MQPLNLKQAITNLQTYLRTVSFFDPRIERVPIDGLYDTDTQNAVASYQRARGLPETSVVDKTTWDTLYDEYLAIRRATERQPSPSFFPTTTPDHISSEGEESAFVAIIQIMLRELSVFFDKIPELEIDGIYGSKTAEAVRAFQKAAMLEVTGKVDLETYNRLNNAYLSISLY